MDEYARTIVGGRGGARAARHNHPRGIEILLKKAKADPDFRKRFLANPVEAAVSIALTLSPTEQAVLLNTPRSTLETMISNATIPARFEPIFRRARTAAALVALTACTVVTAFAGGEEEGAQATPLDYAYPADLAMERIAVIQDALEWYSADHGRYPTTDEWAAADNPLEGYLERSMVFDPWYNRFQYEATVEEGEVVDYRIWSQGETESSPHDDIGPQRSSTREQVTEGPEFAIEFPTNGQVLSVTFSENGEELPFTFTAIAHDREIAWMLDGDDVAWTRGDHTYQTMLDPGEHRLTLVDWDQQVRSVRFTVVVADADE